MKCFHKARIRFIQYNNRLRYSNCLKIWIYIHIRRAQRKLWRSGCKPTCARGPKNNIAKALNVNEENFFTRAETPEDIIRLMIWYDWEHGCGGSVPIDTILLFDNFEEVEKLLKEWYSQKEKLKARTITRAKYLEWMLHCPTEKENNKNSQHR
ncbi:hypothetical protein [Gemmiger sp.]|uniref:hypothetical protein n=1 Tax=Gemmiger sp. TaxID=2049027 RepID=UPI003A93AC2F